MGVRVYGCSDDLIELEGDLREEINCYGTDDDDRGVLLSFSDGTIVELKYGKLGRGIWGITVMTEGDAYEGIDHCSDEDASPHSDVLRLSDGVRWCHAATKWEAIVA